MESNKKNQQNVTKIIMQRPKIFYYENLKYQRKYKKLATIYNPSLTP